MLGRAGGLIGRSKRKCKALQVKRSNEVIPAEPPPLPVIYHVPSLPQPGDRKITMTNAARLVKKKADERERKFSKGGRNDNEKWGGKGKMQVIIMIMGRACQHQ